jgi:beta-mannanase
LTLSNGSESGGAGSTEAKSAITGESPWSNSIVDTELQQINSQFQTLMQQIGQLESSLSSQSQTSALSAEGINAGAQLAGSGEVANTTGGAGDVVVTQPINASASSAPAAAAVSANPTAATTVNEGTMVGAYTGAGEYGEATQLSQELGKTVSPLDYLDYTQAEPQTADWLISQYQPWQQANPGQPMIIGTPLTFSGQTLQQTASGANNSEYVDLAQKLVSAGMGNSVIRLGWEGNGNWYPWGADPTDYIAAYNQAAAAMKSVPGANFSFDWSVSAGETNNTPFTAYYPGNQNVNSIGIDAYDWDFANPSASPEERWNNLLTESGGLQDVANFAQQQGEPFAVPEWGVVQSESAGGTSPGGGDDPYYVNQMAAFMQSQNTAFQSYFDTSGGGIGTTLEQNPQSLAAYLNDFASSSS